MTAIFIILFAIIIKHIKEEIKERTEYFERSRGQLFDEILRIWNSGTEQIYIKIDETKRGIERLEVGNRLTPIPIVKEETRPIKRLRKVHYIDDFPYYEKSPELVKKLLEEQLYNEVKNYIVYEQELIGGNRVIMGSIDIVIGGEK